jgi:hypothetical protein
MSNQLAAPQIDAKRRYLCRHIHTSGHRCASPALLEEQFCYYHNASRRPAVVAGKHRFIDAAEPFVLPVVEDRASALLVASQILGRIASNDLDPTRATRLLYGLQVAGSFLPRELREPRAAASPSASSPVPADLRELIDAPVLDQTLGPIAPIAEFFPPESYAPRNRVADMLYMFRHSHACPNCSAELSMAIPRGAQNPILELTHPQPATTIPEPATNNPEPATTNPEPAILPDLQAGAPHLDSEMWVHDPANHQRTTDDPTLPTLHAVAEPLEAVIPVEVAILAKPESPQMIMRSAPVNLHRLRIEGRRPATYQPGPEAQVSNRRESEG